MVILVNKCPNNHFERVTPNCEAKLISDNCLWLIMLEIKMQDSALYSIYNLLACYTVAITSGVPKEKIVETLNNLSFKNKKIRYCKTDNKDFVYYLVK